MSVVRPENLVAGRSPKIAEIPKEAPGEGSGATPSESEKWIKMDHTCHGVSREDLGADSTLHFCGATIFLGHQISQQKRELVCSKWTSELVLVHWQGWGASSRSTWESLEIGRSKSRVVFSAGL